MVDLVFMVKKNFLKADLSSMYADAKQASFLHSQYYVEGCLLGACACPEIPLPDVWLPWVIKHHQQIKSTQQADQISDALFVYFKQCLANMHNNNLSLPSYAVYSGANSISLSQWCEGILVAHSAREKFWQAAWDKMHASSPENAINMAKDLKHCLLMFTTFADPQKAIEEANNKDAGGAALAEKLPIIARSLPAALQKYVTISGDLAAYLPNQFETFEKRLD
jgi:uncharacterized protein